jgi:transposase
MEDTDLYRHLLGVTSPWEVTRVELSVKDKRVDVRVGHRRGMRFACPNCDAVLPVYDHSEERAWRHLDSCQFATDLDDRVDGRLGPVSHHVGEVVLGV